jgi:hypothetical protein
MHEHERRETALQPGLGMLICMVVALFLVWLPRILRWAMATPAITKASQGATEEMGLLLPQAGAFPPSVWWDLVLSGGLFVGVALAVRSISQPARNKTGLHLSLSARFKLLLVVGVTLLAAYAVNFLLPFPLWRYYNHKRVVLGWIAGRNVGAALGTSAAFLALFLLYYLGYRLCRKQNSRRLWAVVMIGALLFALVNFFVHVFTTTDLYDYIAGGRITGVHGGNPYLQAPNHYPDDPFMEQAAWRDAPSIYGPLWQTISGLIGLLAGNWMWTNVLTYKWVALASYLVSTVIVAATLDRVAPDRALSGTLLFAWNPLILMEGVANAHNDTLMIALLLGSLWVLAQTLPTQARASNPLGRAWGLLFGGLALLLLGMAVLVKVVPIMLFPPFLMLLLFREKGSRRKLGLGLLLLVPVALVFFQYYRGFWEWPEITTTFMQRVEMFRMSLASMTKEILQQHVGEDEAQSLTAWPFLVTFALSYLLVLGRTAYALHRTTHPEQHASSDSRRGFLNTMKRFLLGRWDAGGKQPWDILIEACLTILTLYLLLGSSWFWPWYLMWPITLLALSGDERMVIPLAIAGCAGQLAHVVWNFVWYWMGVTWDTLYQIDKLVVFFVVVPALLVYITSRYKHKLSQSTTRPPATAKFLGR